MLRSIQQVLEVQNDKIIHSLQLLGFTTKKVSWVEIEDTYNNLVNQKLASPEINLA